MIVKHKFCSPDKNEGTEIASATPAKPGVAVSEKSWLIAWFRTSVSKLGSIKIKIDLGGPQHFYKMTVCNLCLLYSKAFLRS